MKTNELLNKIKQIAHKLCIVQNLTIAINYAHIKCNIYSAFNWNAIQSHFFTEIGLQSLEIYYWHF